MSADLSKNYSDLPLWDILFGTFENPKRTTDWSAVRFGFPETDELRLGDMLALRNVRKAGIPWSNFSVLSYAPKMAGSLRIQRCVSDSDSLATPAEFLVATLYFWAWFVMAASYTVSGLDKFVNCPSWRDGSALRRILEGPLARDNSLRTALLDAPDWILQVGTWVALASEVGFAPACMFNHWRQAASVLMMCSECFSW